MISLWCQNNFIDGKMIFSLFILSTVCLYKNVAESENKREHKAVPDYTVGPQEI